MTQSERLAAVLAAIDAANAADPEVVEADGSSQPAALIYGRRMALVLGEFSPGASEHLRIAVRGQHIERWKRPRADYPDGKAGYLAWRRDAGRYHGERVAGLMAGNGYSEPDCERVAALVRKEGIKRDADAQTLEDVACLVFMRWYFADFAGKRTPDELVSIVAKTARKMSPEGRRAALRLPLPADLAQVVEGVED